MRERRCILTMQPASEDTLIRLVMSPDGTLVPDVAARLPGRGMWVTADRAMIDQAVESGQLAKAASRSLKAQVQKSAVPGDLGETIDRLLERRCLDRMGLEQRAGHLVTGFDKIKAALTKKGTGKPALLVTATDGAEDGRRKIKAAVGAKVPEVAVFDREALSNALGRDNVVHVLLMQSGGTDRLKVDFGRLYGMRGLGPLISEAPSHEEGQRNED
ncbi:MULTISPECIES: RNA-binding protein [Kordiimonas]|uniref:RNA-binding protein n=1 Tax=Kordiimonas TaxID=288021 RepID=UPI00257EDF29|nr:RNA-binding protein [Kordiimonas sp. UBA4487]